MPLTDAGYEALRASDFLSTIRDSYEADTGLTPDWEPDLILGNLSALAAQLLGELSEDVQAIVDAIDPNAATGVQLSVVSQLSGTERKGSTKSLASVTLGGTAGTVVGAGRIVQGGGPSGDARWVLQDAVTLPGDALVEAAEAGAIAAGPGDIATIVTPVAGWDSVTNADDAQEGLALEADDALRRRRASSLATGGARGLPALRAQLLALPYITAAAVLDNVHEETRVVSGVTMAPKSYLAVVAPSSLTTDQVQEVLQLLYDYAPIGIRPAGSDQSGVVTGLDGVTKPVSFDYSMSVSASVAFEVVLEDGYQLGDVDGPLRAGVLAYGATLAVGAPLRRLQLIGVAADVEGIAEVAAVTINGTDADLVPSALSAISLTTVTTTEAS